MTNKPKISLGTRKIMTVWRFRFATLFLGLILSLLAVAIAHKEVAFNSNYRSLESRKELGGGTKLFRLSDSKVLKGRKIGVKNTSTKEVNTGAKLSSVENFGTKEKKKLNSVMNKNKGLSSKFSMVGYVPFSSDYHAPRRHPPKNN